MAGDASAFGARSPAGEATGAEWLASPNFGVSEGRVPELSRGEALNTVPLAR